MGGLPREGVVAEKFVPSSLSWVSRRGIWDVPGIWPGCPGPLKVLKKFVQKRFVRIFRSLLTPNRELKPLWYNDHGLKCLPRSQGKCVNESVRCSSHLDTLRTRSPYCSVAVAYTSYEPSRRRPRNTPRGTTGQKSETARSRRSPEYHHL